MLFLTILFVLCSGLILLSNTFVARQTFANNETESNLLVMKENTHYRYLVMGISHARNLSRNTHHVIFEKLIGGPMLNLGQGDGLGGLKNQLLYLSYFIERGNRADSLIFVLSPTLMYSNNVDNIGIAYYREPIKLSFIKAILNQDGTSKYRQILHYFMSKLRYHWLLSTPEIATSNERELPKIDSVEIARGMKLAYPQGMEERIFNERKVVFRELVEFARSNQIEVSIVIPPAVFGKWPGHQKVYSFLKRDYPDMLVLDNSEAIRDAADYYDHHHLNSKGMEKHLYILSRNLKQGGD